MIFKKTREIGVTENKIKIFLLFLGYFKNSEMAHEGNKQKVAK